MQEYKHLYYNFQKRKQETKRVWIISVFFLFIIILVIGVTFYLQKQPEVKMRLVHAIKADKKPEVIPIRFSFYDILASGEAIVAKDSLIQPKKEEIYIQLGAFKSDIKADNFQTELNLKGFNTQVHSLFLPKKTGKWFIVRIGKISDEQELANLKQRLEQHQIEYAIVSRKG